VQRGLSAIAELLVSLSYGERGWCSTQDVSSESDLLSRRPNYVSESVKAHWERRQMFLTVIQRLSDM